MDGLESQIGVDGVRAIADEAGEVMYLARLARLDQQADPRARSGANEMVVQPGDGQQGRDGRFVAADAPVAEDDQIRAAGDTPLGGGK